MPILFLLFTTLVCAKTDCTDGNDCFQLGMIFFHNKAIFKDYDKKGEKYFIKACQLNHGEACDYAGWGTRKDSSMKSATPRQVSFYLKGCRLKNANSCYNYACHLSLLGKKMDAEKYLYEAVEFGYKNSESLRDDKDLTGVDKIRVIDMIEKRSVK